MTPVLIKSFAALTAIAGHVIVAAAEGGVNAATASTDPSIGIADSLGADADGMLDVTQVGWAEVRAGGSFKFGDPLTSDAEGHAIKAETEAGKTVRIVGIAQSDADKGDIAPLLVSPGLLASA